VPESLDCTNPARVRHRADVLCRAADAGRKTAAELQEQLQEAKQKLSDMTAEQEALHVECDNLRTAVSCPAAMRLLYVLYDGLPLRSAKAYEGVQHGCGMQNANELWLCFVLLRGLHLQASEMPDMGSLYFYYP